MIESSSTTAFPERDCEVEVSRVFGRRAATRHGRLRVAQCVACRRYADACTYLGTCYVATRAPLLMWSARARSGGQTMPRPTRRLKDGGSANCVRIRKRVSGSMRSATFAQPPHALAINRIHIKQERMEDNQEMNANQGFKNVGNSAFLNVRR